LHTASFSWYEYLMNDSWIALADRRGLKLLVLETSHTIRFVLRRARRENAECFWTVLTPQHAQFIEQLLQMGSTAAALKLLEHLATDMGRIAPSEPPVPAWLPEYVTIPDDHDREWNN